MAKTKQIEKKPDFLKDKIHIILIACCVLIIFNLIGTCSTKNAVTTTHKALIVKVDVLETKVDQMNIVLNDILPAMEEYIEDEFIEQFLQFAMYEDDIDKKRLSLSNLKIKLDEFRKERAKNKD